jgi:methionine-rich copper-binding protein CopC
MLNIQCSFTYLNRGLTAILSMLFASHALAHAGLENSMPAANAHLTNSPPELRLNYESPVMLMSLTLMDNSGQVIDIHFKASSNLEKTHKLPLPTLNKGSYTLNWAAMGKDGHNVKGSFVFMLEAIQTTTQPTEKNHAEMHHEGNAK